MREVPHLDESGLGMTRFGNAKNDGRRGAGSSCARDLMWSNVRELEWGELIDTG